MKFLKEDLQKAADIGSAEVSKSFSKLSKENVSVATSIVEAVSYDFIVENLEAQMKNTIITFAQMIGEMDGVSLLSMSRESALSLVDILNGQTVGTTGVLKDIDRSAVKETLNILSNAYLNALLKTTNTVMLFGEPYIMTANNLDNVIDRLKNEKMEKDETVFVFKTALNITDHQITAQLFIIFNKKIVEMING